MKFQTKLTYETRPDKAAYVWDKYHEILSSGSVLDVGADECHLKTYLPEGVKYTGVDFCDNPEVIRVDLDREPLPFEDQTFDTVLCFDVLEHLDGFHAVFDRLCALTRKWLILSLPNPYGSLFQDLVSKGHGIGDSLQHYGLPSERPMDRHRWFYAASDADRFMRERSQQNHMKVVHADRYRALSPTEHGFGVTLARAKQRFLLKQLMPTCHLADFEPVTLWWVLNRLPDEENS